MNSQTPKSQLSSFLENEWEWHLQTDPILATQIGDARYNSVMPDYSLNGHAREKQHTQDARSRLQQIDRAKLDPEDQLNYDLYAEFLATTIAGFQFPQELLAITQLDGIQELGPRLHLYHAFRDPGDYESYIARLHQFPQTIDQIMERLHLGLQKHITQPREPLRSVAAQIQSAAVTDAGKSAFYEPFARMADNIPAAQQQQLRSAAAEAVEKSVAPAYKRLLRFWEEQYYPKTRESIAISELPDGRAWYEQRIRKETTTNLSPEEIHEKGIAEVSRIRSAMEAVMRDAGYSGEFREFVQFLKTDPRFFYTRAEDLVTGYRDICKRLDAEIPRLFRRLPRLTYGVREMPAHSAPSMPTGFYDYGSLEAGRPAWYFVNTYRLDMRPKWEMEVLSVHEAVPGHHLQLALAREMEDVPAFRKYLTHNAFIEGWGLYSESLGTELGFYTDPYSRFGWLSYDMWRAIRLVVDTGMHAFGWSRNRAIEFFRENSSKSEQDIIVEVDRYIVWPAQALSYKIGQMKIQELRKNAEARLGAAFNIRDFHDRILSFGSLPLSVLEKLM